MKLVPNYKISDSSGIFFLNIRYIIWRVKFRMVMCEISCTIISVVSLVTVLLLHIVCDIIIDIMLFFKIYSFLTFFCFFMAPNIWNSHNNMHIKYIVSHINHVSFISVWILKIFSSWTASKIHEAHCWFSKTIDKIYFHWTHSFHILKQNSLNHIQIYW